MSSTRKVRTLTSKAMELFEGQSLDFEKRLDKKEINLKESLKSVPTTFTNITEINSLESDIIDNLSSYEATVIVYLQFLESAKTEVSLKIRDKVKKQWKKMQNAVESCKEFLDKHRQELLEKIVAASRSSKASSTTQQKISSMEKDLDLARKEAKLIKEKARCELKEREVEADLKVIRQTKALNALKREIDEDDVSENDFPNLPLLSEPEKVQAYLESSTKAEQPEKPCPTTISSEFSNYILRKELTFSRIQYFSDNPTQYQSWKNSFKLVTSEIGVNSVEEVDLLIKFLGPESRKHAVNLKLVYKDPSTCLSKI